jgi:hypothetical protein
MAECLRVPGETLEFLKGRRIEAHILPTTEAAELYNRLAKEGPVGGCFTRPAEIRGDVEAGGGLARLFGFGNFQRRFTEGARKGISS